MGALERDYKRQKTLNDDDKMNPLAITNRSSVNTYLGGGMFVFKLFIIRRVFFHINGACKIAPDKSDIRLCMQSI